MKLKLNDRYTCMWRVTVRKFHKLTILEIAESIAELS